jgi:hypothetical protein
MFGSHLVIEYNTNYEKVLHILIQCPWEAGKILERGS